MDVEDNIITLYNYLYNKDYDKNLIAIDKIILGKIGLNDIKYPLDSNNEEYKGIIKNILDSNFKLDNIDDKLNIIRLFRYSESTFQTFIKISFYKSKNEIDNLDSPINNDLLFSYLLSSLVINRETPHILIPIFNIDMNLDSIKDIIFNNSKFEIIKEHIDNKMISDVCCVQIKENYFSLKLLSDYLKNNSFNYKLLLFQLIYTLLKINKHYYGFKHNNLTTNSIYLIFNNDIINERYTYLNTVYTIPNEFNIKICNFENASIPKFYNDNKKTTNAVHDILTFAKDLMKYKNEIDTDTVKFLESISEYNDYKELLDTDYFKIYHNIDNKISNKKISTNIIMHTRKIKKESNNKPNTRYIKQSGGEDRMIKKPYRTEANTPYLSNDQRETYSKKIAEAPPKKEQPLLLEQKIYDTTKRDDKSKFPPTSIPTYDAGEMIGKMFPYAQPQSKNQAPIQKIYNVNLANPVGDHTTINRIYEDVLPGTPNVYSAISVYERTELVNFLRNIMLENVDGEEMTITGGTKSILSYIKLLEINPYTLQKNPYNDLPIDFLIYRSSYPIRFNESTNTIGMAKTSMGINMRIYKMSIGSMTCQNVQDINCDMFDVWRDIKYYNQVKQVVNNKISPNFICPILYKIDSQSRIDWGKITLIKNKKISNEDIVMLNLNQQKINKKHQIQASELFNSNNKMITDKSNEYSKSRLDLYNRFINEGKFKTAELAEKFKQKYITNYEDNKLDLNKDSGKVLVLLTEAPTNNIIQWASSLSEAFGTIIKMISTGYHTHEVWCSVIFQLVYAFAVLQKLELYIDNFSLENNVYIKDLFYDSNNVGSWIYIVNNIEYYVPNYGYLVLIDSKYNDIIQKYNIYGKSMTNNDKLYKIYGPIYKDYDASVNYKDKILQQFKTIINPDNFGYLLKQKGGLQVDDKTKDLLNKLYNLVNTESDISKFMQLLFTNFMHNRLGTYLMVSEKEKIIQSPLNNIQKSKLMIWEEKNNLYQWVILLEDIIDNGITKSKILCNNNSIIQEKLVFTGSLFSYPNYEVIQNQSKTNLRYDDKYIFETYNLDNL
jgi:hypothetical protein